MLKFDSKVCKNTCDKKHNSDSIQDFFGFFNSRFKMNFASFVVLVFLFNASTSKNAPPILMTAIEEELQQMSSEDDELVLAHVVSVNLREPNIVFLFIFGIFVCRQHFLIRILFTQIYRHGERNIAKVFPNDPYK